MVPQLHIEHQHPATINYNTLQVIKSIFPQMVLLFFGPEYTALGETQAVCETVLYYHSFRFWFVMSLKILYFFPPLLVLFWLVLFTWLIANNSLIFLDLQKYVADFYGFFVHFYQTIQLWEQCLHFHASSRKSRFSHMPELGFITVQNCRRRYICSAVLVFWQVHSLGRAATWV